MKIQLDRTIPNNKGSRQGGQVKKDNQIEEPDEKQRLCPKARYCTGIGRCPDEDVICPL